MRRFRWCFSLAVSLGFAVAARADVITLSVTGSGLSGTVLELPNPSHGTIYYYHFSNTTVTYTATLTTAQLAACQSNPTCYSTTPPNPYGTYPYPDRYNLVDGRDYSLAVTVQGFGTFDAPSQSLTIDNLGPNSSGEILFTYPGGPSFGAALSLGLVPNLEQNLVSVQAGSLFGLPGSEQLGVPILQPGHNGDLFLSIAPEEFTVNLSAPTGSTAVTPEPGTWVMVGTGLLGGLGAVPRRGKRRILQNS